MMQPHKSVLPPRKLDAVASLLSTLPRQTLVRIVEIMESEDNGMPTTEILGRMRPLLREIRPARSTAPRRVFCIPFEDALHDRKLSRKLRGRISRAAIAPAWDLLMERVPTVFAAAASLKAATNPVEIQDACCRFWSACAQGIATLLAAPKAIPGQGCKAATARFIAEIEEMGKFLRIAPYTAELAARLYAKPIPTLPREQVLEVAKIYRLVAEKVPQHEEYVLAYLVNRLQQPSDILKVARTLTGGHRGKLVATDLGICGDLLLDTLETSSAAIIEESEASKSEHELHDSVLRFLDTMHGLKGSVEFHRNGTQAKRLDEIRQRMEGSLGRHVIEPACDVIVNAVRASADAMTAALRAGATTVHARIEGSSSGNPLEIAEKRAAILAACGSAPALGAARSARDRIDDTLVALRDEAALILRQNGDPQTSRFQVAAVVRMMEVLGDHKGAESVRVAGRPIFIAA